MKWTSFLLFASRLAVVAAFASFMTLPLAGQGNRQQVQGTWFGTGTNACLVAGPNVSPGFNLLPGPTDLTPTDGVSFQTSSTQVTLNLNADGTGTGEFHELALTPLTPVSKTSYPPASGVSASSTKGSFSYTYTIADDGTLTVTFLSVDGQVLTGPSAGFTFSVVPPPPPLTGRIGQDGKSMLLGSAEPPTVETLRITRGPSFDRICYRTRVFVPIHEDGGN